MADTSQRKANLPVTLMDAGEELLQKAKAVGNDIRERVWRAMDGHALPPPHSDGQIPDPPP
jgi:hypothetical protein